MCACTKIDEVCHSVVAQLDRPAAVWSNHAIYQTSQPEPCDIIARVPSELPAASTARSPLRRAVSELFILRSAQDRKRGRRWVVWCKHQRTPLFRCRLHNAVVPFLSAEILAGRRERGREFALHSHGRKWEGGVRPTANHPFNNNWDIAEREKERRGRRKRN